MATRVKVFQTNPLNTAGRVDFELEERVNEWLAASPNLRIVSVQTTSLAPLPDEGHKSGSVLCMIFYVDAAIEGERKAGFLRE